MLSDNGRISLKLNLAEFEMPPTRDALVIGREAPIGTEAATIMLDAIAPDEFVVMKIEDDLIESIIIRRSLLRSVPSELLINTVLEHARGLIRHQPLLKVRVEVAYVTEKILDAWKQE